MISQKIPFAQSLNIAAQKRALDVINLLGKALPCSVVSVSGSIVTVNFEIKSYATLSNVTVPMFGPEYIRYPIQAGCLGVVFPADAYLGGVSGLGGGVADLTLPANLSALVFFPCGNKNFSATDDPNALVLYGPNGAIIRDMGSKTVLKVTQTGASLALPAGDTLTVTTLPAIPGAPGALWQDSSKFVKVS